MKKEQLALYAVTDRSRLIGVTLAEAVESALRGGVTLVQLREKELSDTDFIKSALEIKAVCRKYNVPLIINDNIKVALASDADGVHLGQRDASPAEARRILGENKIVGVTAKTVGQALAAQKSGADYLGSGAVFGTSTKPDAVKMELDTLKKITASVDIPVVAIGGINADNIDKLTNTGIAGAAIVSGIFAEDDIYTASKTLFNKIQKIITEE